MSIVIKKNFNWFYAPLIHLYCQPQEFRESNVFSHVCLSFCLSTEGFHVTYVHLFKLVTWWPPSPALNKHGDPLGPSLASRTCSNLFTWDWTAFLLSHMVDEFLKQHCSQIHRLLSYRPFPAEWKNVYGEPSYRTVSRGHSVPRQAVRRLCE